MNRRSFISTIVSALVLCRVLPKSKSVVRIGRKHTPPFFYIYGNPGGGKSDLLKYYDVPYHLPEKDAGTWHGIKRSEYPQIKASLEKAYNRQDTFFSTLKAKVK